MIETIETDEPIVRPKNTKKHDSKTKRQPPYNVILLNDDDHTVEYVVAMCQKVFGYPVAKGVQIAAEVHVTKRCILWTESLELAEFETGTNSFVGQRRIG